jgi:hypothetical protein
MYDADRRLGNMNPNETVSYTPSDYGNFVVLRGGSRLLSCGNGGFELAVQAVSVSDIHGHFSIENGRLAPLRDIVDDPEISGSLGSQSAYSKIMSKITVDVPDAAMAQLAVTPQALAVEMRMATAVRLYSQRRMSIHEAALFAGSDEFTFRQQLSGYGIAIFDLSREELEAELA